MISKDYIQTLVKEKIEGTSVFIVDITVGGNQQINVLVDKPEGISIDECVGISRHIEGNLDREEQDFELQVSSPGLDVPFKVREQYDKNIGRTVKVYTKDNKKHEGVLSEVTNDFVVLKWQEKERLEGKKKKVLVDKEETLFFENENDQVCIRETKIVISFN
jgi:ribosome maturation factor RimP